MLLPKHPRLMSDSELSDWAESLIKRKAPESSELDYKAEISIQDKNSRIELAKDVSSFANEAGGILLYGVPEKEEDGIPVPKDLSECGIKIPSNLPIDIENILLDIVAPALPELFIRILNLKEISSRSLLMIYHPESWNQPHMIEGYKTARYYRRGNFKTVVMNERAIEAAYLRRKVAQANTDTFFAMGNFKDIPKDGKFFRSIICPRFPLIRKEEMLEEQFRNWLNVNPPNQRSGDWVPFLNGWCFRGIPTGKFHGKQYELCLFHNGAISFDMDLDYVLKDQSDEVTYLDINRTEKVFEEMILPYAIKAFEFLRISGPVSIQVNLYNVKKLNALIPPVDWFADPNLGPTPIHRESITFVEESSVSEVTLNSPKILKTLTNRLASAFGIWRK